MKQSESSPDRPTKKKLREELAELNEEYRFLGAEAAAGSGAASARRAEIARELRSLSLQLHLREPEVTVQVPRTVTGHPIRVGEAVFFKGEYKVKASVAQHIMHMIDRDRENELNRLRSNGEEINLRPIGDQAAMSGSNEREL